MFFPFFGILIYYLFGQEYRKNKIFNRKQVLNQSTVKTIHDELELDGESIRKVDDYLDNKVKLVKPFYNNKNSPLTLCNDLKIYKSGDDKFQGFLEDLKSAKHHIHLEYYIIEDGKFGTAFRCFM